MPSTAIVVLNWNGADDTIACLESLLTLHGDNVGIFVCDNDSGDDSVKRIRSWIVNSLPRSNAVRQAAGKPIYQLVDLAACDSLSDASLTVGNVLALVQNGRNGGYAAGNNVGLRLAKEAGFDYFWILNNDTEVTAEALQWLLKRMGEDQTIGMCGSTLVYSHQRDLVQARGGSTFLDLKGYGIAIGGRSTLSDSMSRDEVEAQLRYISGAAMFVSKAFLDVVGYMQEDYFLYWEEIDWATRGKGRFKLGYAPDSLVFHKVGASIGTNDFGSSSPLSDYYITRGQFKYCWRFSKKSIPYALVRLLRSIASWLLRGEFGRAALLLRASLGLTYRPLSYGLGK